MTSKSLYKSPKNEQFEEVAAACLEQMQSEIRNFITNCKVR